MQVGLLNLILFGAKYELIMFCKRHVHSLAYSVDPEEQSDLGPHCLLQRQLKGPADSPQQSPFCRY